MTETISPDDLRTCQKAHQRAVHAQQELQKAQHALGQAQERYVAAMGARDFSISEALERKGLPPSTGFNLETGEIGQLGGNGVPPQPHAEAKVSEVSQDYAQGRHDADANRRANALGRRKKGA